MKQIKAIPLVLANLDMIRELRIKGGTFNSIAQKLGISSRLLYNLIYFCKNIVNEEYSKNDIFILRNRIAFKDLMVTDEDKNNKVNKSEILNTNNTNEEREKLIRESYWSRIDREQCLRITRAWESEDERIRMVQDQLFKACFDHFIEFETEEIDRNGEVRILKKQQPIPGSYNAQRFFLVNRDPKHWHSETIENADCESLGSKFNKIQVEFIDADTEANQKRIADLESKIKGNNNGND